MIQLVPMKPLSILAGVLLGIYSSLCFGSLARVAVLGGQPVFQPPTTLDKVSTLNATMVAGSLWYDDDYNVFQNPATIFDSHNQASLSVGGNTALQGGAFVTHDYFAFGAYINRSEQLSLGQPGGGFERFQNAGGSSAAFGANSPAEFFFGIDYGVKGGVHLTTARQREILGGGSDRTARYWHVDAGADLLGLQPFVGVSFASQYVEATPTPMTTDLKSTLDQFDAGVRYHYESFSPYFIWNQQREQVWAVPSRTSVGATTRSFGVGVGHEISPYDGLRVYSHLGFWRAGLNDTSDLGVSGYGRSDWTRYVVPLNVAAEYDYAEWLTFRAGLAYDPVNIVIKQEGSATTSSGKTYWQNGGLRPRLGATISYKQAMFDLAFGKGPNTVATNIDASGRRNFNLGLSRDIFAVVTMNLKW